MTECNVIGSASIPRQQSGPPESDRSPQVRVKLLFCQTFLSLA